MSDRRRILPGWRTPYPRNSARNSSVQKLQFIPLTCRLGMNVSLDRAEFGRGRRGGQFTYVPGYLWIPGGLNPRGLTAAGSVPGSCSTLSAAPSRLPAFPPRFLPRSPGCPTAPVWFTKVGGSGGAEAAARRRRRGCCCSLLTRGINVHQYMGRACCPRLQDFPVVCLSHMTSNPTP
ncbi:unnamed protein product [Pleuronectes platessa]|uniref:Uncharacterized protein n=1 Tax=Pleuronectes platessa TaxID=8262 RepID=A0A9N7VFB7_PLEPL|nr:unnamed protein product [Pleuronectes platessa]